MKHILYGCLLSTTIFCTSSSPVTLSEVIKDVGSSVDTQVTEILHHHVSRLGYTSLALTAGTAGIITSYKGLSRLCDGIEHDKKKTVTAGSIQLTCGLSTTIISIASLYFLWRK